MAMAAGMAIGALGGCRKAGAPTASPVAAILSADTAAQLPADLIAFAEALPEGVEAFGYADAGQTLEQLIGGAGELSENRALYADLTAMTQRRWGVDIRRLGGVGFVVFEKQPLLVAAVASAPPKQGEAAEELMLGKLGKLTVLGEPESVTAFLAAGKQGKRLYQTHAGWVRNALSRAAGSFAFVSVDVQKQLAGAPAKVQAALGDVLHATFSVAANGAVMAATSKPSTAGKLRVLVEQGLAMTRGAAAAQLANLASDPSGPLQAAVLRHLSEALWKSIEQKVEGDELVIRLGWHAPVLPTRNPTTSSARLMVPGEVGMLQIDLGAPLFDLMIAAVDVLRAPLDRASLKREATAELAKLLGIEGLNPHGLLISVGEPGLLISLHNAPVAADGERLTLLGGAVPAVATPWGLALSPLPQQGSQLLGAAMMAANDGEKGLPLESNELFAAEDSLLRGYLDATRLPPVLLQRLPQSMREIRHLAFTSSVTRSEIEARTAPGKTKSVADDLATLINMINPPLSEELYRNRAQGSATEEILAIMANYQRVSVNRYLTPTSVTDDKITFVAEIPRMRTEMMIGAAVVGMVSAVAIPAFMSYLHSSPRRSDP